MRLCQLVNRYRATLLWLLAIATFLALYSQIQASRAESVRISCVEQNERHDGAIATLDTVIAAATEDATPERIRQLEQSRASTVLLIEAVVPKRNCEARVDELVGWRPFAPF
jgi:hypothetical protein